jgi:cell division protein FtsX
MLSAYIYQRAKLSHSDTVREVRESMEHFSRDVFAVIDFVSSWGIAVIAAVVVAVIATVVYSEA